MRNFYPQFFYICPQPRFIGKSQTVNTKIKDLHTLLKTKGEEIMEPMGKKNTKKFLNIKQKHKNPPKTMK